MLSDLWGRLTGMVSLLWREVAKFGTVGGGRGAGLVVEVVGGEEGGRLVLEARSRDAGLRVGGVEEPVAGDAPRTRRRRLRGIGPVRVLDSLGLLHV